jgi:hypothetical protein
MPAEVVIKRFAQLRDVVAGNGLWARISGTLQWVTLDPDTTLGANSDTHVATQKGTKAYVDAETAARASAITAEASTRSAADSAEATARDAAITTEATARAAADALKVNLTAIDTDPTFAANSDSKVPSQKAVKTAIANSGSLTATPIKTADYAAAAGDFVPVDTTAGSRTITLPTAPADGTRVAVKHVIQGGTNTVTINCGGSDVINKTGGAVTATLTLLAQGMIFHYQASTHIWYIEADDLALAQLDAHNDARYDAAGVASSAVLAAVPVLVNQDEVFAVAGPKTISGVTEVTFPVFVAPFPLRVTAIRIISTSDCVADNANFWIAMARRRRSSQPVMPYSSVVLADNPYAYWRLDETVGTPGAADSGSGGHALVYSTPTPPTLGQPSLVRRCSDKSALFVPGSSTSVGSAVDYAWDFSSNMVTIEAFIKSNILSVGNGGAPSTSRRSIFVRPTVGLQPSMELGGGVAGNGRLAIVMPGFFGPETASFVILPGNVYHAVYRRSGWDGTKATEDFFINGVKQTVVNTNSQKAFTNSTTGTYIGSRPGAGSPVGQFFDGVIDDVAVYNAALSDAQILAHADAGVVQSEIARKTTQDVFTGGEGFTAWQPWTFEGAYFDNYAQTLDQGDVVMLGFYPFGAPGPLTDCTIEVSYEAL